MFPMHSLRTLCVAFAGGLVLLSSTLHAQVPAKSAAAAPSVAPPATAPSAAAVSPAATTASPALRELVQLARERAPEVVLGRSALTASRSSYANARLAPLGNPLLEVKV